MSLATTKAHVSRLLTKLDVANRVEIALLVQEGDRRPALELVRPRLHLAVRARKDARGRLSMIVG